MTAQRTAWRVRRHAILSVCAALAAAAVAPTAAAGLPSDSAGNQTALPYLVGTIRFAEDVGPFTGLDASTGEPVFNNTFPHGTLLGTSADGLTIFVGAGNSLAAVNASTGRGMWAVSPLVPSANLQVIGGYWAPDGQQRYIVVYAMANPGAYADLYLLRVDVLLRNVTAVVNTNQYNVYAVSPSGMAYASRDLNFDPCVLFNISSPNLSQCPCSLPVTDNIVIDPSGVASVVDFNTASVTIETYVMNGSSAKRMGSASASVSTPGGSVEFGSMGDGDGHTVYFSAFFSDNVRNLLVAFDTSAAAAPRALWHTWAEYGCGNAAISVVYNSTGTFFLDRNTGSVSHHISGQIDACVATGDGGFLLSTGTNVARFDSTFTQVWQTPSKQMALAACPSPVGVPVIAGYLNCNVNDQ